MLIAAFVLLATVALRTRAGAGWREGFVLALGATGLLIVVSTVVPSQFGALRLGVVAWIWGLACVAVLMLLRPRRLDARVDLASPTESRIGSWAESRIESCVELVAVALLLLLTLVVATQSVPRVYDALAYHLPRVFFWIQNQSAAFYPTPETRQNYISPFTAYATVQLMLLHDRDWAPLLVQWTAYLGVIVTATLVADELGTRPATRTLVAALIVTIPNLALQASTALSDVVTTFWITAAVWLVLRARRAPRGGAKVAVAAAALVGAAFGLAVLAKASSYFFLLPFGLLWVLRPGLLGRSELRRGALWRRAAEVALAATVVLALNAYHYAQAQLAYGSPLSSAGHTSYLNPSFTPPALAGSVLKHTSAHLLLPVTTAPVRIELGDSWNRGVASTVRGILRRLGVDPDAGNLPAGTRYSLALDGPTPPPVANSPQSSGSPLHFLLGTAAVLFALARPRGRPGLRAFAVASFAGFLLLAACFRWQPWLGRFHLPYLVLATVLLAVLVAPSFEGMSGAPLARALRLGLVAALLASTLTLTVLHQEQDPRTVLTTPRRDLHLQAELVRQLAERIAHVETIGILAPPNVIEYPLLRAVRDSAPQARVWHVFASLPWRGAERRSRDDPQAIVLVTQYADPRAADLVRLRRARYREVLANPMGRVFVQRRRPIDRPDRPDRPVR